MENSVRALHSPMAGVELMSSTSPTTRQNSRSKRDLRVTLASSEQEVIAAQRLRYSVFADEMGARLNTPVAGVDEDEFDPFCEHLIVRDESTGSIVGTYRLLPPDAARRLGKYYTEDEFDLSSLAHIRSRMVELGRSCVAAEYRSGAVIGLLWSGLADFMTDYGFEHLIGCASIHMQDGGHIAASITRRLQASHMSPAECRVTPHNPLPMDRLDTSLAAAGIPPLIKGYIRAGAWVCGDPAWDPDFNTADLPMLLSMSNISSRYFRHFSSSMIPLSL